MNWLWALSLVIDLLLQPGYMIWIHYLLLCASYTATIVISSDYKPFAGVVFHYLWNFLILYGLVTLPFLEFGGFIIGSGYVTFGFSWLLSFAVASITSEWARFWTCFLLCVILDLFQHLLMTIEKTSDTSDTSKEVKVGLFTSMPDGYKLSSEKRLFSDWKFKDISTTFTVTKSSKKSFDYEYLNRSFQDSLLSKPKEELLETKEALLSEGILSKIDEALAKLDEADEESSSFQDDHPNNQELLVSQEMLSNTKEPLSFQDDHPNNQEMLVSQEPLSSQEAKRQWEKTILLSELSALEGLSATLNYPAVMILSKCMITRVTNNDTLLSSSSVQDLYTLFTSENETSHEVDDETFDGSNKASQTFDDSNKASHDHERTLEKTLLLSKLDDMVRLSSTLNYPAVSIFINRMVDHIVNNDQRFVIANIRDLKDYIMAIQTTSEPLNESSDSNNESLPEPSNESSNSNEVFLPESNNESFPEPDVPEQVPEVSLPALEVSLPEVSLFKSNEALPDEISFLLDNDSNQTSHVFPSS